MLEERFGVVRKDTSWRSFANLRFRFVWEKLVCVPLGVIGQQSCGALRSGVV